MSTVEQDGFELRGEPTPLSTLVTDLWRSRGLIRILARKDFFVRYRRASFGLLWSVGLPLIQAAVLALVLGKISPFETGISLPVFVFSGVLPWTLFSAAVDGGTGAIVGGQSVAAQVYFPRAVLPMTTVMSNVYGFVPGIAILLVMALSLGASLDAHVLLMVPGFVLLVALATAFALPLAGLQVYFRDVRHIVIAMMTPWYWGSAVFYPLEATGSLARWLELNPVVGVVQMFHAAVGADVEWVRPAMISVVWAVVLLTGTALLYRRFDRVFVDLL